MKPRLTSWISRSLAVACLLSFAAAANAAEEKMEAQLIWGTNDKESPNPQHKPVEAETRQRLNQLPLKFTNYFLVNRKTFSLSDNGPQRVQLSSKCQIDVKKQEKNEVEVSLIGKGSQVVKRTQPLPKGEMLVLGGNAPNATAWFVIVKRSE